MIKIKIPDLLEGLNHFTFIESPQSLGIEGPSPFTKEIEVKVAVDKNGGNLYINAHINSTGDFICDRCLKNFRRKVEGELVLYYTSERNILSFLPEGEEEFRWLAPGDLEIDITKELHDTLLLAVPMKILCKEDCRGLCPHCGADLNEGPCGCDAPQIDPRWEALRKLLE